MLPFTYFVYVRRNNNYILCAILEITCNLITKIIEKTTKKRTKTGNTAQLRRIGVLVSLTSDYLEHGTNIKLNCIRDRDT